MKRFHLTLLSAAIALVVIGAVTFGALNYFNSPKRGTPMVYSDNALLLELWNDYKSNNIEAGSGRTIDKSQNNITTSEGESYTLLRAVWMDDRETFDKSWEFTRNNLQRPDNLLSWKFGQKSDGSYGVLTELGGQNTASDADGDVALALMMAYTRWNHPEYLYLSKQIMNSIWEKEVVMVAGQPVLMANDIERNSANTVVVNPSYFAPYSYKLFAKVDPSHNWTALADSSYDLINRLSAADLGSARSNGLPPNWITLNRKTGAFIPNAAANLDTNYGYDAFRTPWRLALDYAWFKDERAKNSLSKFEFLNTEWQKNSNLKTVYAHDGTVVDNYESPAAYGTALSYFSVMHPETAKKVYDQKVAPLYSPDRQQWKNSLAYYDDNWTWFGIALYQNALPNLAIENN